MLLSPSIARMLTTSNLQSLRVLEKRNMEIDMEARFFAEYSSERCPISGRRELSTRKHVTKSSRSLDEKRVLFVEDTSPLDLEPRRGGDQKTRALFSPPILSNDYFSSAQNTVHHNC